MNRPSGPSGGEIARGAGFAAAKGALLIGLAVVIGVVLLQQVDGNGKAAGSTPPTTKAPTVTSTTVAAGPTTTVTTVAPLPTQSPAELRVIVLNGGAATGQARVMRTKLLGKGYTNQPDANNWAGRHQTGNTVMCRAGRDQEAAALAVAVGGGSPVPIQAFPTPSPPNSDGPGEPAQCVVVVGA